MIQRRRALIQVQTIMIVAIIAVAGVGTYLLGVTPRARASQLPDPDEVKALLVQLVDVEKRAPGIVVGMIAADPQESWVIGYGKLSASDIRAPDGDTVFEIGSISKGFTGILLAQAVLNGEVDLDDPISLYLPEGVVAPEYEGRPITLLDLATHTSGLPRMPSNFHPEDPSNPYADYTMDQMYDFLSEYSLTRAPGTVCEYSNYGFGLLGNLLVQQAGEDDYETLLLKRITGPLGMISTGIKLTPDMLSRLATPHSSYSVAASNWDLPTFAGAGGIRSTANDMLKLLAANIGLTGTELQPAIQMANTPYYQRDAFGYMGLGWSLGQTSEGMIHIHNGKTGGYYSYITWNSQRKVGVVILTNAAISIDDIGNQLLQGITNGQPLIPQIVEIMLASWAIITVGCAATLVWVLRKQPVSHGAQLMWLLTTLFLGPLGLVFYWLTVEQPKHSGVTSGEVSLGRRALGSAAWAAAGNVVGGIGVLALQPYLYSDISLQIAASLLMPLLVGWLIFTVSRWISRSEAEHDFPRSRPFFAEVVSTCLVLIGLYPVVYYSLIRWINLWSFPFGGWYQNIQFYPLLWGLLCLGTISGTIVTYPFHLWMLRRGISRWGSEGVLSKGSVRGIAWYIQVTLMVLSIVCMLAAIFLTMQVA